MSKVILGMCDLGFYGPLSYDLQNIETVIVVLTLCQGCFYVNYDSKSFLRQHAVFYRLLFAIDIVVFPPVLTESQILFYN